MEFIFFLKIIVKKLSLIHEVSSVPIKRLINFLHCNPFTIRVVHFITHGVSFLSPKN